MLITLRNFFPDLLKKGRELYPYLKGAYRAGKDLELVQDNLQTITSSCILLFCTMKNECHRLDYFLAYYRNIGVDHFIFVDNGSTDNTTRFLTEQKDVTRFYTEASYSHANFGMHWLNYLLFKYGRGHWCITCDPDEFLVYPKMKSRDLRELTEYLASIRQGSFFTLLVDMYGSTTIPETVYEPGTDPLVVCPYFDRNGYSKRYNRRINAFWVQGGVRGRVFFSDAPEKAPALNKVPLVKWKWNYVYISSMHSLLPRYLNRCINKNKVTGALLHFKFISQLDIKVKEELVAKQHYDNSFEYKQYAKALVSKTQMYDPTVSVRYENCDSLESLGLINTGEW